MHVRVRVRARPVSVGVAVEGLAAGVIVVGDEVLRRHVAHSPERIA
jgi:hypothetical protein